jgi:hypothetical protein
MPYTRDQQRVIRDALVALYPRTDDARRVLWDAGLDASRYRLDGDVLGVWTGIVDKAEAADDLRAIVRVAQREYPRHQGLQSLGGTPREGAADALDFRKLTGKQWSALQHALIDAFSNYRELEMFVMHQLGENLNAIVGSQSLNVAVYELIQWSQARGHTERLYRAACEERPQHEALLAFGRTGPSP